MKKLTFAAVTPILKRVLTVAAEQPCGVQVVEGVGLVPFNFQSFTRLAAVFAEEVGNPFF